MNLEYYYWYFKSALPKRLCEEIIQYGNSQTEKILTGGATENDEISDEERKKLRKKKIKYCLVRRKLAL